MYVWEDDEPFRRSKSAHGSFASYVFHSLWTCWVWQVLDVGYQGSATPSSQALDPNRAPMI